MSFFNRDTLCLLCDRRERKHPNYARAREAETNAVREGNSNFHGIGCPPELYQPLGNPEA